MKPQQIKVKTVTSNPDLAVQNSRGEQRNNYLLAFIVHQSRQRAGVKETIITSNSEHSTKKNHEIRWWSLEKMDKELGAVKAKAWREVLKPRNDPLTGSDNELLVEYPVPSDWESWCEADIKQFILKTTNDMLVDDDMGHQDDLNKSVMGVGNGIESSSAAPSAEIKVERFAKLILFMLQLFLA